MKTCKYYIKHLDTIKAYINCLYALDGCLTGGLLHIVTDDGNLEDSDIQWCLDNCTAHPEREDAGIGKLICEELLKLPMEQRRLVCETESVVEAFCKGSDRCDRCPICNKGLSYWR